MSWFSKVFHKVTHAVTKPFRHIVKAVTKPVASILGLGGGGGVSYDSGTQQTLQVAAPAVAAPEPTQGQEEQDLIKKKRKANVGKRALLIDTGGSGGTGGVTGTGLNL